MKHYRMLTVLRSAAIPFILVFCGLLSAYATAATVTIKNTSASLSTNYEIRSGGVSLFNGSLGPGQEVTRSAAYDIVMIYNPGGGAACSGVAPDCGTMYFGRTFFLSYDAVVLFGDDNPGCPTSTFNWGPSNYCAGSAPITPNGQSFTITNTTGGATGSAAVSCASGSWTITSSTCTANLAAPTGLTATDGTNTGSIVLGWGAVGGASGYRLQRRHQGTPTWIDLYVGAATSFNWTPLADYSVFDFQIRAENATGSSAWSPIETGFIRPALVPVFVSQSGIPAKIGVGQSFTYTQNWRNDGSETWSGGAHGTAPFNPANTSVWGTGNLGFAGSTATGATVTTTIIGVAPSSPGTYPVQRIFQKSGATSGTASPLVNVQVIGAPTCSSVTPNITTTYNSNATVTLTLQGASSVESASIAAWGSINSQDDIRRYPMALVEGVWTVTLPITPHYTPGESRIAFQANVSNSLFAEAICAQTSISFQPLPVPVVTLTPTMGNFTLAGPMAGFVLNRNSGEFAKVEVNLGAYNHLKVNIEFASPSGGVGSVQYGPLLSNFTPGSVGSMKMSPNYYEATIPAWTRYTGNVKVSYADPEAASQGVISVSPVAVDIAPGQMVVEAVPAEGLPMSISSRVHNANFYDRTLHGGFVGGIFQSPGLAQVVGFNGINDAGQWAATNVDYALLHDKDIVSIARAVPPSGVTLLQPIEFRSQVFRLPVQAPLSVSATDGTREDDVKVTWPAVASGSSIRYRVFRDSVEITQPTGVAALEFMDTPPARGVTYNYSVKTLINNVASNRQTEDTGFVPACRAARLVGASIDSGMNSIIGLVEKMECLEGLTGIGRINALDASQIAFTGSNPKYRAFTYPIPANLNDGSHTLRATLESPGVTINASRSYDIPIVVDRASITVNKMTILYDGMPAQGGLEASSIGRFGVMMDGGSGIGFAEEIK